MADRPDHPGHDAVAADTFPLAPDDRQAEHRFGRAPTSALPESSHPALRWLDSPAARGVGVPA